MPHIITQSCCNDGSCVFACPVNCIHPTPDEPGFATSEMLYIDPVACVDCGACVSACPVGAISPDTRLAPEQLPFIEVNASYYPTRPVDLKLPPTSKLAPVIPAAQVHVRRRPLTVAIVGSGPAAMYAADELLTQPGVWVNVFEKLPTPYGLVRAGLAPDHQNTKKVTELFDRVAEHRCFRFFLNVEIGRHLSHAELLVHHHAVLYAVGAPDDRRLDIDGMGIPGTGTATELVAWINGHPDFAYLPIDLSHERVIVIGNGNVALDVARLLTADPDYLARTDISEFALHVFGGSAVREVVVAARRGPAHSAFTLPELIGLKAASEVVLDAGGRKLVEGDLATASDSLTRKKLEILSSLGDSSKLTSRRRIRLAYQLTPKRVLGNQRATGVEFSVTGTEESRQLDAGLVLTSVGYRGKRIPDLPFDEAAAVIPNDGGRVVDPSRGRPMPGVYVAGWIKRGPTGFIGTNKSCSVQTVQAVVADFNAGWLTDPVAEPMALVKLVQARQPDAVDSARWRAIDAAEIAQGNVAGRPRRKFTDVAEMLAVTASAPPPRLVARLRALL
ncbi:FAD-dependent oxidoreductase [Mycobacterium lepromatosis]|uniref:ferredoxin--NADP(+) reductase n=1 Tax=Mycobacterium lepromatosis TaxID=480418 RepID=A0A0F4EPE1_9MYCO|nr:FAD-dependent oxidoreductase [Mycobacterium lepromatosis]KJX74758.1 ferredoxin [Mycobacterium lepromatosis]UKN43013.1 ferredoxin/ferredoxin--NADP reductase [Mycobacterium lepromatosis]